jgi:hypothetical protein
MSGDKTPGEFMVAIFALVGEPLVQPCGQMVSAATLRLRQTGIHLSRDSRWSIAYSEELISASIMASATRGHAE